MAFPSSNQPILVPLDAIQAFFVEYADALVGQLQPFREIQNPFLPWTYLALGVGRTLVLPYSSIIPEWYRDAGTASRLHQLSIVRDITYTKGVADTMDMGEFLPRLQSNASFGSTILQPAIQALSINNHTGYAMATAFNAGFTTDAWDGKKFWVLDTAADADQHPVNIGKASLGNYHTALENKTPSPDTIKELLQTLVSRKGYDGKPLGTMRRPFIWGPTERRLDFEDHLERMQWSTVDGTGGSNTALQRADFVEIPGLRSDMWGAAVQPSTPWELAFVLMTGAMPNQSVPTMPQIKGFQLDLRGKDTEPHRLVELVDESRAESQLGRWVGVRVKVNETVALHSPAAFIAAFTGAAS